MSIRDVKIIILEILIIVLECLIIERIDILFFVL